MCIWKIGLKVLKAKKSLYWLNKFFLNQIVIEWEGFSTTPSFMFKIFFLCYVISSFTRE
jgi:hypothetical protein